MSEQCKICSDKEENAADHITACGHHFHTECLREWTQTRKSCPYCNGSLDLSIFRAIEHDDMALLPESLADLNVEDDEGRSPLILVAVKNRHEMALSLITLGGNVYRNDNQEVIHTSYDRNFEVMKWQVEHGADVPAISVISTFKNGHLEVAKWLVELGADVRAQDNQAVIDATFGRHLEVLKWLVEHGADVCARDNQAVIDASYFGHLEVVMWLVEHGADVCAQDNQNKDLHNLFKTPPNNTEKWSDKSLNILKGHCLESSTATLLYMSRHCCKFCRWRFRLSSLLSAV